MSQPCEQKETIQEMASIIGALRELPAAIRDMQSDFKKMMEKLQESIADGREYKTLIQQNTNAIQELRVVDHEQWQALEDLKKQIEHSVQRASARIEELERWQAGLNGGKPTGLADRLDELLRSHERHSGRQKLWLAVPSIIAILALLNSMVK